MKVDMNDKRTEAVRRMEAMGIAPMIIDDFRKQGNVQLFETAMGIGYWPDDGMKKVISDFEAEHDALVYTGIRNIFNLDGTRCEVVSLFFVSDYREEWGMDMDDITGGSPFVLAYNRTIPEFSDMGCIGIGRTCAGGLKRIC